MQSAALKQSNLIPRRFAPAGPTVHGVAPVRRLGRRAGYLELTTFECGAAARHAITAAFRQLVDATAVILDLRRHRGGEESMASYITSCLFATEPMARERYAATPLPPGAVPGSPAPRLLGAAIDVLVSRETSTIGRAFAVNLERLGRARIVGPAPKRWAPRRKRRLPSPSED